MMKVVGEEGTSTDDFVTYLKGEFVDAVYLQQNAFDEVDAANAIDRQRYVFERLLRMLRTHLVFAEKSQARGFFHKLTQTWKDWNGTEFQSKEFETIEEQITKMIAEVSDYAE